MSVTESSSIGKGRTTVGGVPASDHGGCSNVRVRRQVLEGIVVLGQQAIFSVRARDRGKRLSAIVVNSVISNSCGDNDERRGEESEGGDELHVCGCRGAKVRFAGVWYQCIPKLL